MGHAFDDRRYAAILDGLDTLQLIVATEDDATIQAMVDSTSDAELSRQVANLAWFFQAAAAISSRGFVEGSFACVDPDRRLVRYLQHVARARSSAYLSISQNQAGMNFTEGGIVLSPTDEAPHILANDAQTLLFVGIEPTDAGSTASADETKTLPVTLLKPTREGVETAHDFAAHTADYLPAPGQARPPYIFCGNASGSPRTERVPADLKAEWESLKARLDVHQDNSLDADDRRRGFVKRLARYIDKRQYVASHDLSCLAVEASSVSAAERGVGAMLVWAEAAIGHPAAAPDERFLRDLADFCTTLRRRYPDASQRGGREVTIDLAEAVGSLGAEVASHVEADRARRDAAR